MAKESRVNGLASVLTAANEDMGPKSAGTNNRMMQRQEELRSETSMREISISADSTSGASTVSWLITPTI